MKKHLIAYFEKDDRKRVERYFKNYTVESSDTDLYLSALTNCLAKNSLDYIEMLWAAGVSVNFANAKTQDFFAGRILRALSLSPAHIPVVQKMFDLGLDVSKDAVKSVHYYLNVALLELLQKNNVRLTFENKYLLKQAVQKDDLEQFKFFLEKSLVYPLDEEMIRRYAMGHIKDYYNVYMERYTLAHTTTEATAPKKTHKL